MHRRKKILRKNNLLQEIEKLRHHDIRKYYKLVNNSRKEFKLSRNASRDTDGTLLTDYKRSGVPTIFPPY